MNKLLRLLLPNSISTYFNTIQQRIIQLEKTVHNQKRMIRNMEFTVETLISSPKFEYSDEIGMNWQNERKKIVSHIITNSNIDAIVETGTFIGNTTGYLHIKYNLPVYTCELNHQFFLLSQSRLKDLKQVYFHNSDSRSFLKSLTKSELAHSNIFFYLDAHWYNDLPLREEISIICKNWRNFAIMVDDFEVPGDSGYGYDDYGPGKALNLKHIEDLLNEYKLKPFFPSINSENETGSKRGCVVLAPEGKLMVELTKIKSLIQFNNSF